MTNKELYLKFSGLNTKDQVKLFISHRYSCDFIDCSDGTGTYYYFTKSFTEKNSGARISYADLNVYDTIENKQYYGRLYSTICDDLSKENMYSFMLYMKSSKEDSNWKKSIATSDIEMICDK